MSHRAVNIIRASNAMMAIEYIMYERVIEGRGGTMNSMEMGS